MASQSLKTINTTDRDLQLVQGNVADVVNRLQQTPFFNGNIVSASLTTGQDNVIAHGLDHKPTIWFLVDQNSNSVVWRTAWDSTHITLHSSANCSVKIWVN